MSWLGPLVNGIDRSSSIQPFKYTLDEGSRSKELYRAKEQNRLILDRKDKDLRIKNDNRLSNWEKQNPYNFSKKKNSVSYEKGIRNDTFNKEPLQTIENTINNIPGTNFRRESKTFNCREQHKDTNNEPLEDHSTSLDSIGRIRKNRKKM